MRQGTLRVLGLVLAILSVGPVCSAAFLFSNSTDTISVAGNTVLGDQATYEASVEFNSTSYPTGIYGGGGNIYNAWQFAAEDERLTISDGGSASAYGFPVGYPNSLQGGTLTTGVWYDLAWVYDGSQERLYINGSLVASMAGSGTIGSGSSAVAAVGAIFRDGTIAQSFLGEIQSLRISDVARYAGSSYTPTFGDFSDDASTLLLYDFDSAPIGQTITDLSGNGHTGTLGTGFVGATSPTFVSVPEPASATLLGLVAGVCCLRRRPIRHT
jgi:hypothetical protein